MYKRARLYFLMFFLAFAFSSAIVVYIDSRPRYWQDFVPLGAQVDAAYPVGKNIWLMQLVVRSDIAIPYSRTIVLDLNTNQTHALGDFLTQYYPMGYAHGNLWLFAEQSYIQSIRGSHILARIGAPDDIEGQVYAYNANGLQKELDVTIKENGIPFLCKGLMRTSTFGSSEVRFFTVGEREISTWFGVPAKVNQLPFCASDNATYVSAGDSHFVVADKKPTRRKYALAGRFALDGTWVGVPQDESCRYISPDNADAFEGAYLGEVTNAAHGYYPEMDEVIVSGACKEAFSANKYVHITTKDWQTTAYYPDGVTESFYGKMIGFAGDTLVLKSDLAAHVLTYNGQEWQRRKYKTKDWFELFPTIEEDDLPQQ